MSLRLLFAFIFAALFAPALAAQLAEQESRTLNVRVGFEVLIDGEADSSLKSLINYVHYASGSEFDSAEYDQELKRYRGEWGMLVSGRPIIVKLSGEGWRNEITFDSYTIPEEGDLDLGIKKLDVQELIGLDNALVISSLTHQSDESMETLDSGLWLHLDSATLDMQGRARTYMIEPGAGGKFIAVIQRLTPDNENIRRWSDKDIQALSFSFLSSHTRTPIKSTGGVYDRKKGNAFVFTNSEITSPFVIARMELSLREPMAWAGTPEAKTRGHVIPDEKVNLKYDFYMHFFFKVNGRNLDAWSRYLGKGVFEARMLIPEGAFTAGAVTTFFSSNAKFTFDRLEPVTLHAGKAITVPFRGLAPEISVLEVTRELEQEDEYISTKVFAKDADSELLEYFLSAKDKNSFQGRDYDLEDSNSIYFRHSDSCHHIMLATENYRPVQITLGEKPAIQRVELTETWPEAKSALGGGDSVESDPNKAKIRVIVETAAGIELPDTGADFVIALYGVNSVGPLMRVFNFDEEGRTEQSLSWGSPGNKGRARLLAADGLNGYADFEVADPVEFEVKKGGPAIVLTLNKEPTLEPVDEVIMKASCLGRPMSYWSWVEEIGIEGSKDDGTTLEQCVVLYFEDQDGPKITRVNKDTFNFAYPPLVKFEIPKELTDQFIRIEIHAEDVVIPVTEAGLYGVYKRNQFEDWVKIQVWHQGKSYVQWEFDIPDGSKDRLVTLTPPKRLVTYKGDDQGLSWALRYAGNQRFRVPAGVTMPLIPREYTLEAFQKDVRVYEGKPLSLTFGTPMEIDFPQAGYHVEAGQIQIPLDQKTLQILADTRIGVKVYSNIARPNTFAQQIGSDWSDPLGWMKSTHPAKVEDGKVIISGVPFNADLLVQLRVIDGDKRFATAPIEASIEAFKGQKQASTTLAQPTFYRVREQGTLPGGLAVRDKTDAPKGRDYYEEIRLSLSIKGSILLPASGVLIGLEHECSLFYRDSANRQSLSRLSATPSAKSMGWHDADLPIIPAIMSTIRAAWIAEDKRRGWSPSDTFSGPSKNNGLGGGGPVRGGGGPAKKKD